LPIAIASIIDIPKPSRWIEGRTKISIIESNFVIQV